MSKLEDPSRRSHEAVVSSGGCAPVWALGAFVALAAVGGFTVWRWMVDLSRAPAERKVTVEAGPPAAEAERQDVEASPRSVEYDGQTIVGDVVIRTIDDALAEGDVGAALAIAIERDPERLRELLAGGVDPDTPIHYGSSWNVPLEKAVRQGAPGSFDVLLDAGADPDAADDGGKTALHTAASKGRLDVVERLLAAGAGPDPATDRGTRPVERAAFNGHQEVVAALLAAGAPFHEALHNAAWNGHDGLVQWLLARGASPLEKTRHGDGPLRGAAMNGHLSTVEILLAAGARPGPEARRRAAYAGHDEILRAFVAAGVRFDGPPEYWGPLFAAAHQGHASTVELLLELGASREAFEDDPSPLEIARERGHDDVVALLESR